MKLKFFLILLFFGIGRMFAQTSVLVFSKGKDRYEIRKEWGNITVLTFEKEKIKGVIDSFNLSMIRLRTTKDEVWIEIKNIKAFRRCGYLFAIGTIGLGWHCRKTKIKGYKWEIKKLK